MLENFYDAKRALTALRGLGANGVQEVLSALGYEFPTHALDGKKKVKVYRTEGYHLLPYAERGAYGGSRGIYEPEVPAYVVATSKKEAVSMCGATEHSVSAAMRVTHEIQPTDYRYHLAATSPGMVVFTVKGSEFGEPHLVPAATSAAEEA